MTPTAHTPAAATQPEVGTRPRIEGERELELLEATLDVLADVGYDRLTMDAVAAHARASKATLYRRWSSKAALVIDALISQKEPPTLPDTGTLRGDLLGTYCGLGGLTDEHQIAILGSVITAVGRDPDFAEAFRRDFIGPKSAVTNEIFARAQARGEIADGVDIDLIAPALPGIVLHQYFLLGASPDPDFIARVLDQIILPAITAAADTSHQTPKEDS